MQFHWWYILVGIILFFILFGKKKGGVVSTRLTASMQVLDSRFQDCKSEADFTSFKNDGPEHIDIEIEQLPLKVNEELEFLINGNLLATVKVKRNLEAEFDHWADEDIEFPMVHDGDELIIVYDNTEVLKGIFRFNQ
ncbi:hypothetical protein [Kangiella sp. HZ709]|uniref:hypothetical protein n=1 Tax=Kangiella sp. HZ709 TaxID=2666328 RepID=UPI0018A1F04C|nr:hypothetical protein [Kangiella sp. HZ709]